MKDARQLVVEVADAATGDVIVAIRIGAAWTDTLASDPKLGDDRQTQHRYNAACAAALAAAGQSQDEAPLDDAAKAKLRGQALDWLKTELTVWDKLLESDRTFIVQTLSHWQQDADLAGIRDAAALAKLPVDEQKSFTQLWADVALTSKRRHNWRTFAPSWKAN